MDDFGTGTGLAALGFWLFVASMVVVGVWNNIRKREAQHETLRRIVESGQHIDSELTDKLLAISNGAEDEEVDRELRVTGYVLLSLSPGLALLGVFMGVGLAIELLYILLGVAALLLCLSGGMFYAARMVAREYGNNSDHQSNQR